MDSVSYVYFSGTIYCICLKSQLVVLQFSKSSARALVYLATVQQRQFRTKWLLWNTKCFAFFRSLKLSLPLLYSVRFVFVSTFNLQLGRAFAVGITNLSKQAVCVKADAPADHVYQRRTWDEFKRVLSVAHAIQPVGRALNIHKLHCEYNQMYFTSYLSLVLILKYRLTKLSPSFWIALYNQNILGTANYSPVVKRPGRWSHRPHPCNIAVRNATSTFTSLIKPWWLGKKSVEAPMHNGNCCFPIWIKKNVIRIITSWINYQIIRSVTSYTFLISDFVTLWYLSWRFLFK
jgi:hypothetical protein